MAPRLIVLALLVCQINMGVKCEGIYQGTIAKAGQFPYQVYIEQHSNFQWIPVCGGVIISERLVLTAAHCFELKFDAVKIYFGTVNISDNFETGQQRLIVNRKNIVIHQEWDKNQQINDIALIKLPADLQFDEYIQPARLPDPSKYYENDEAVLSAWEYINDENYLEDSFILHYYRSNIQPKDKCKKKYLSYQPGKFFTSSYICLEPKCDKNCLQVSSGPLVVRNEHGNNTLVGLAVCDLNGICDTQFQIVFTRVTSFLEWIANVIVV